VGAVVASEPKCPIDAKKRCRLLSFQVQGFWIPFNKALLAWIQVAEEPPQRWSFDRSNDASNRRGASMTGMALGLETEVGTPNMSEVSIEQELQGLTEDELFLRLGYMHVGSTAVPESPKSLVERGRALFDQVKTVLQPIVCRNYHKHPNYRFASSGDQQ
jgi:hypothetical protein